MEKFGLERKNFLKEYSEQMEIAGELTDTIEVRPSREKGAPPVLLAPGWASTIPVYQPSFKVLAGEGRRVFSLNHPQRGNEMHFTDEELEKLKAFPKEELQKASNLLELMDKKGASEDEKVDVIAHSEGCINAIAAALAHPEKFRNIVLYGPPGFFGKDSKMHLSLGWLKWQAAGRKGITSMNEMPVSDEDKARAEAHGTVAIEYPELVDPPHAEETRKTAITEGAKYIASNPLRAVKEVMNMPSVQLDEIIQELREKGIGIVIMSGVDDPLFPTEKMAAYLKKGSIDGFLAVRGSHAQIGENPERYIVAAEQMLTALEKKRSGPENA